MFKLCRLLSVPCWYLSIFCAIGLLWMDHARVCGPRRFVWKFHCTYLFHYCLFGVHSGGVFVDGTTHHPKNPIVPIYALQEMLLQESARGLNVVQYVRYFHKTTVVFSNFQKNKQNRTNKHKSRQSRSKVHYIHVHVHTSIM